jgi:ketosteroid isomerase-like protein
MSRQNVDIVRKMYEAANAAGRLDANFDVLAPEVEFHVSGTFPDLDRVYRGHEGMRELNDRLSDPWEELSLDPQSFIDAGSQVLVLSQFRARGRDGLEVTRDTAILWTLRKGRIVRMDAFSHPDGALQAAGLSSPGEA